MSNTTTLIRKNRKAVTLVEVMISLLILGIVMATGYLFINRTFLSLERQRQSMDTLHEARDFLALIERDLRQMTRIINLDTAFRNSLFDEENALLYSLVLEIPDAKGTGYTTVTYTYEGTKGYKENDKNTKKIIYRQEKENIKKPIITSQLKYLKVWGTDGTIFRNRNADESLETYRNYLAPHYYFPGNPTGLKTYAGIRGVEVQLCMNEMFDSTGQPIKERTFVTRIYSRVLNSKYE